MWEQKKSTLKLSVYNLRVTDRAHDAEREPRTTRKVIEVAIGGSQKATQIHIIKRNAFRCVD